MRQQNVNQSFSTLLSESCQGCHSTLMSIFSSASSPTLSVLCDEFPVCQTLYLHSPSLFPPSFMPFLYHLWPIPVLQPGFGCGLRWGDGQWLVCTFSSKLKYSCMCACVAVWERLHVYPSLAFVYIYVSVHDCGIKNTAACKDVCMSICVHLCRSVHVQRFLPGDAWSPVVWFSSQIKTRHINYPWLALRALTQPTEEEELAEQASLIRHNNMNCTHLKNIHFLKLKAAAESFSVNVLKHDKIQSFM